MLSRRAGLTASAALSCKISGKLAANNERMQSTCSTKMYCTCSAMCLPVVSYNSAFGRWDRWAGSCRMLPPACLNLLALYVIHSLVLLLHSQLTFDTELEEFVFQCSGSVGEVRQLMTHSTQTIDEVVSDLVHVVDVRQHLVQWQHLTTENTTRPVPLFTLSVRLTHTHAPRVWLHGVTWRHRWRHWSTRHRHFPI